MQTPRTEFSQALKAIAVEKGLEPSVILETIKQAIVAAYKRDARERGEEVEEFEYEVDLNSTNGEARIIAWPLDLPDKKKDVTPPGFGRIATQTAKQVIHQKIKEAEKDAIMADYSGKVGGLISGMILRFDGPNVRVDLGRTEGLMPVEERVPDERLAPNQRLSFLFKEIKDTPKGKQIILSRSDPEFVKKLFGREVPEVASGSVEIKAVVREPGARTKIAVFSNQPGVDPVGSCVGQKGVRVQAVTNELGDERVDIVPWSEDNKDYIRAALSPAEGLGVKLNQKEKVAIVEAPEDQLSLAIGREGQNARLAAKLTGWRIEVKGSDEVLKPSGQKEEKGSTEKEKKKIKVKSKAKNLKKKEEKKANTKNKSSRKKKETKSEPEERTTKEG